MRILLAVALIGLAACGDPTAPNTLAGKWTAPQVDVFRSVTFTLNDEGGSVSGSWTGTLIPSSGWAGEVTGSRSGESFTLRMVPANLACDRGYIIEAERSGDNATGRAFMATCAGTKVGAGYAVALSR